MFYFYSSFLLNLFGCSSGSVDLTVHVDKEAADAGNRLRDYSRLQIFGFRTVES